MDKAFLCPRCGAKILLSEAADNVCCFCSSVLQQKHELQTVDWAFHAPKYVNKDKVKVFRCEDCDKVIFASKTSSLTPKNCVHCGGRTVLEEKSSAVKMPVGIKNVSFIYTREDAEKAYIQDVKKEGLKLRFAKGDSCKECISPLYIPCFIYDYTINAEAVLSVLPIVRSMRSKGDSFINLLTGEDMTLERTSAAEPYPKNFVAEMVWQNVPILAAGCIEEKNFEKISPFSVRGVADEEERIPEDGLFPEVDLAWGNVHSALLSQVQNWVREYILSETIDHYKISSYVDKTKYEKGLGQLIYIPIWQMRIKHKHDIYSWYMNGLTGVTSGIVETKTGETEQEEMKTDLHALNKKRIKNYRSNEISNAENSVNCRTYMVDTVSSSIMLETSLNESASDKSLFHLERSQKNAAVSFTVPVSEAFEKEADEELKQRRSQPIPSAPVPLPTEHSPLYLMKQEIQNRSLGRGQRLPEKALDRNVGGEVTFGYDDITREARAVEVGLNDMPEYDPSGPNPFKTKK